jgi:hypothetical protein
MLNHQEYKQWIKGNLIPNPPKITVTDYASFRSLQVINLQHHVNENILAQGEVNDMLW